MCSRRIVRCVLSVSLSVLVAWLAAVSPATAKPVRKLTDKRPVLNVAIGTGSPLGLYFVVGQAICRLLALRESGGPELDTIRPIVNCAAPPSAGSIANIQGLRADRYNFAIVQSDWQHHAYNGSARFTGKRFERLRSVISLYPEVFHLVAGRDSTVSDFAGLGGRRVNLGSPGSGLRATFEILLEAAGKDATWFAEALEIDYAEQGGKLCAGDVDVGAYSIGVPSSLVAQVLEECKGRLISIDEVIVQRLVDKFPFYAPAQVPAETYPSIESDTFSLGLKATLVTTSDTPDAVVYEVVRTIFEGISEFRAMHLSFGELRATKMIREGMSAPLHPGAARYFAERGWLTER